LTAHSPPTPNVGASSDIDPRLVRLRRQLVAREEVVKQLNRRLLELERAQPQTEQRAPYGSPSGSDVRLATLEA
jgi:hypothetical protein